MSRSARVHGVLVSLTLLFLATATVPAVAQGGPVVDAALTEEPFTCANAFDRCAWRNATLLVQDGAFTLTAAVSWHCVATHTNGGGCYGPTMPLEPTGAAVASSSDAHAVSAGAGSAWPQSAHADARVAGVHVASVTVADGNAFVTVLP